MEGAGKTSAGAVVCGHSRDRVRSSSYQSLMSAEAGTARDENSELPFRAANLHGGILPLPAPTPAGDKPPPYIGSGEIVADFSTDLLSRGIRAWIPACAGMTIAGIGGF